MSTAGGQILQIELAQKPKLQSGCSKAQAGFFKSIVYKSFFFFFNKAQDSKMFLSSLQNTLVLSSPNFPYFSG
jgi:hypothetical protein